MRITDADLLAWMQQYFWTLTRIGGLLMSAPLLSRQVPPRVRLMLALAVTVVLAPLLPAGPALEMFSSAWMLTLMQQLLIGIVMGFVLQLVFEAVMLGGEMIAFSMGLSFAQVTDPVRNAGAPLTGQLLILFASLLFLSMSGHLLMFEMIAKSFHTLPVAPLGIGPDQLMQVVLWGSEIFSGGMRIALPAVISLLLVNLAFGVISRAAPALNIQSVGFPLSLLAGLLLLQLTLPNLHAVFVDQINLAWEFIGTLMRKN